MSAHIFVVEDVNNKGSDTFAVTQDESKSKWLIIRKRPRQGGNSPLVGTGDTLEEAFVELARILTNG